MLHNYIVKKSHSYLAAVAECVAGCVAIKY